jgi:hypothetical protein
LVAAGAGVVSLTGALHPSVTGTGRMSLAIDEVFPEATGDREPGSNAFLRWVLLMQREIGGRRRIAIDRLAAELVWNDESTRKTSTFACERALVTADQYERLRRDLYQISLALKALSEGADRLVSCLKSIPTPKGCQIPFFADASTAANLIPSAGQPEATCPEPPTSEGLTEALLELEDLECVSRLLEEALVPTLVSVGGRVKRPEPSARSIAEVSVGVTTVDLEPVSLGHVYRPLFDVTGRWSLHEASAWSIRLGGSVGMVAGSLGEPVPTDDRWRLAGFVECASADPGKERSLSSTAVVARLGLEHAPYLRVEGNDPDPLRVLAELSFAPPWRRVGFRPTLNVWGSKALSGGHFRAGITGAVEYRFR